MVELFFDLLNESICLIFNLHHTEWETYMRNNLVSLKELSSQTQDLLVLSGDGHKHVLSEHSKQERDFPWHFHCLVAVLYFIP